MKKTTITKEQEKEIVAIYSLTNIGTEPLSLRFRISKKRINQIFKNYNISKKKKGNQITNNIIEIKENYKKIRSISSNNFIVKCKKTNKEFNDYNNKSGILTIHLKKIFPNIKIPSNYNKKLFLKENGFQWHEQYFNILLKKEKQTRKCKYCDWETTDIKNKTGCYEIHLKNTHNKTINEFIKQFPEEIKYHPNFKKIKKRNESFKDTDSYIICKICNKKLKKLTNTHFIQHGVTVKEYKEKYSILSTNSLNSTKNQSKITTEYNLKHGTTCPNKKSSYEINFETKLKKINIKYITPFIYKGKKFDFYLPKIDTVIEIDGEVFHKNYLENLTIKTIQNSINDYKKSNLIGYDFKFYRIRYNKNEIFNSENELINLIINNSYTPNYSISYNQKIILKEYFKNYIETKGKSKLEKYIPLLLKFIRTFHSEFPYPENNDNLNDIINTIKNYDLSRVYDENTNTFSNICYSIGNTYLKSLFKSYWDCNYKGNESPIHAWNNDTTMKRIIKYRIGCNDSNEIFDFSLKNLIKGLSANRNTISFFKPILAASIYNHYLPKNIENPIVFDPCCGFGGRILGFKSLFPHGKYIGLEPNKKIYGELSILSSKFEDNNELYNCKLEDFNKNIKYDICFTSIPYFDLENYNNYFDYNSYSQWKKEFIDKLLTYNKLIINMSEELCNKLNLNKYIDSYIIKSQSHFGNKEKEVMIKLNFS